MQTLVKMCENVVFVFCFFVVGHALSPEHRSFEGWIVRTSIALPFIARKYGGVFSGFFLEGIALLRVLHSYHFRR